jgi:hypothetical protein
MNIDEIGEVLKLFEESQFDEQLIEAEGVRIAARGSRNRDPARSARPRAGGPGRASARADLRDPASRSPKQDRRRGRARR